MSDLIDRQAALDAIQQRADRIDSVYSAFWEGLIIAQDIVKNVPTAESERKWIPVTEALPINDVDVIVSVLDDSGDTPYRFTSVGWCTPNGQYWVVDNEMCYGVIAWKPLPEPWRGEE